MAYNNFKYELSLFLLIFAFVIVLPLIIDFFAGKIFDYTGSILRDKYSLENVVGISVLSLGMFKWNGTFNLFLKTILILSIIITLVYIIEGLMCKKRNKNVK